MENTYCQIVNHDISDQTCLSSQGQEACSGCASPHRRCEVCKRNAIVVAATGLCGHCLRQELTAEKQASKAIVHISRVCRECNEREVRNAKLKLCLTCTVAEFGNGLDPKAQDVALGEISTPETVSGPKTVFPIETKIKRLEGVAKTHEGKILAQIVRQVIDDLHELERLRKEKD